MSEITTMPARARRIIHFLGSAADEEPDNFFFRVLAFLFSFLLLTLGFQFRVLLFSLISLPEI
jgi:hypothetical protein